MSTLELTTIEGIGNVPVAFPDGLSASGGTANGITYLNASKVLTSGSALTFDGTELVNSGRITANDFKSNNGAYYLISSGSTYGSLVSSVGSLTLNANNGSNLIFQVASTEQMRLTNTGLGIGTSSPGTKLDVNGQIRATNYRHQFWNEFNYEEPFDQTQQTQVQTWEWNCTSYAQMEVTFLVNQTNGGDSNNRYLRAIWANNHTTHQWLVLDDVGNISGATFTFAVTGPNGESNEIGGKLKITMNYAGSFYSVVSPRIIIKLFFGDFYSYVHTAA